MNTNISLQNPHNTSSNSMQLLILFCIMVILISAILIFLFNRTSVSEKTINSLVKDYNDLINFEKDTNKREQDYNTEYKDFYTKVLEKIVTLRLKIGDAINEISAKHNKNNCQEYCIEETNNLLQKISLDKKKAEHTNNDFR